MALEKENNVTLHCFCSFLFVSICACWEIANASRINTEESLHTCFQAPWNMNFRGSLNEGHSSAKHNLLLLRGNVCHEMLKTRLTEVSVYPINDLTSEVFILVKDRGKRSKRNTSNIVISLMILTRIGQESAE